MRMPIFNGEDSSNTIIIAGTTGSGKSVTTRNIAWWISQRRPVYILDWAGRDHYLGYHANTNPKNLPLNTLPTPLKGKYFYYKNDEARNKMNYERLVYPNLKKYKVKHLTSLGFTGTSPANLDIILSKTTTKDLKELFLKVQDAPPNKLNKMVKAPLLRDLQLLVIEKNSWCLNNNTELNIEEFILSGENGVFSYNDLYVARAEIIFFLDTLRNLIDKKKIKKLPFLFIEEGHKIFRKDVDALSEELDNFILTCRKLGVGLCITMPTIQYINDAVASDIKDWILGRFKGSNSYLARKYIGHYSVGQIEELKMDRFTGERELYYYNSDQDRAFIFKGYESPQEFNRRI